MDFLMNLHHKLKAGLAKFISEQNNKTTRYDVQLSVKKMMAQIEGDLHYGYKTDVRLLWETMTLKEKTLWFVANKVFPVIGDTVRSLTSNLNSARLSASVAEMEGEYDEPDYEYVKLPVWAESNPKNTFSVVAKIKLAKPIEFVSMSVQLENKDG
jgi:hypothetical protein